MTVPHSYRKTNKKSSNRYLLMHPTGELTFTNDLISCLPLKGKLFELVPYLGLDATSLDYVWEEVIVNSLPGAFRLSE